LTIGDAGIGIRQSLVSRAPASDLAAIEMAVALQVSSIDDIGRGQGLPTTRDHVCGVGGSMTIRSGLSIVTFSQSGVVHPRSAQAMRGTIIGLTVPCR
jgi:hypothetical protein